MTAINSVRFRVKPGREEEFVEGHRKMELKFPGLRRAWFFKTGDRSYCMVGVWKEMKSLVDARPAMIANLDKFRDCLEDMGGGTGVTDPVSGEAIIETGGGEGRGGKAKKGGRAAAAGAAGAAGAGATGAGATRRAERRAKKLAERKTERRAKGGGGGGGKGKGKGKEKGGKQ